MNTPICSFLRKYADIDNLRLHMPGHKGVGEIEKYDLTEIDGADSLYEARGIIKESESNASHLFGSYTLYSAEGSSLAIKAMLHLALIGKCEGGCPTILAGRNAHKVFVSAAAQLGFKIEWLYTGSSYLCCEITPKAVEEKLSLMKHLPCAVYITSPDYLGNMADIKGISEVCKSHGVLLLVDNAHGAYLAFTDPSMHPIHLGADMCVDSAHKTLPCLTGGAYLHISDRMPEAIKSRAKAALALYGSTSPSYLILASLDMVNAYLENGYNKKLTDFVDKLREVKRTLATVGYEVVGNEPMKLTLKTRSYGYTGYEIGEYLKKHKIIHEFADPDHLVLMPAPEIRDEQLAKLEVTLLALKKKAPLTAMPPKLVPSEAVLTPKEAVLREAESVSVDEAEGRILADITVGCPPAVPIVVSGERITKEAIDAFKYYGIDTCYVIK